MKSLFSKKVYVSLSITFLFSLCMVPGVTSKSHYGMPSSPDASTRYLFFLHGNIVEVGGPEGVHPKHREWGPHDYYGILKAFEQRGFKVISEERPRRTDPEKYAKKVAKQVKTLLDAGVPPENITVSGFSKGGFITIVASHILQDPDINFVILSGCCGDGPHARGYNQVILPMAPSLKGRFLSVYDTNDDECGTCEEVFAIAEEASPAEVKTREIKLQVGLGHGQFWKVRKEWFEPVVEWIKKPD